MNKTKFFTSVGFSHTGFGFETAQRILNVGPNTMTKLFRLNLLDITSDEQEGRNLNYVGYSLEFLASARNRPLLVPEGERALVCSMGVEEHRNVPSPYFDAQGLRCADCLAEVEAQVNKDTWEQICDGHLRVTGHWRVSESDAKFLKDNHCIFVASYAGFILEGGRIVDYLGRSQFSSNGGRYFIIQPFDPKERHRFAHNFLPSRQGPMNRVWTHEELLKEAERADF